MGNLSKSFFVNIPLCHRIRLGFVTGIFLLVIELWFPSSGCAEGHSSVQVETSPVSEDPAQAAWLRVKARESQERYRMRVEIPRAAMKSPLSEESSSAGDVIDAKTFSPSAESGSINVRNLTLGALLCLAGILAVLKLAPDQVGRIATTLITKQSSRVRQPELSVKALDDERAFAEFLVAFKAVPRTKPSNGSAGIRPPWKNRGEGTNNPLEVLADPLKTFFAATPPRLAEMRNLLAAVGRPAAQDPRKLMLKDLRAFLATFKESVSVPELLPVRQVTSAVEGLVAQLADRPGNATANTLRTVANGLDLLSELCQRGFQTDLPTNPPFRLLAVDDDLISRHAVAVALKKIFNQPDLAANSEAALAQASMIGYDVIFLDILMPGMDGFELCSSIRQSSMNRLTPIIFVTSQGDFEARSTSNLCGGTDLIAKPFLSFELTLKALVCALRTRLDKATVQSLRQVRSVEGLSPLN